VQGHPFIPAPPLQCCITPAAPCLLLPECPPAATGAPGQPPSPPVCSGVDDSRVAQGTVTGQSSISEGSLMDKATALASSAAHCCTTSGNCPSSSLGASGMAVAAGCTSLRAWLWAPCDAELQGWQHSGPGTIGKGATGDASNSNASKPPVLRVLACTDVAYLPTQILCIERCPNAECDGPPPDVADGQGLFEVRISKGCYSRPILTNLFKGKSSY